MSDSDLSNMRSVVKLALIKIGIRCDLVGFNYLCYAIELVVINPRLIHKLCKGLYFAGEVLDVDGYTGGFNLQIAFSTGAAAGNAQSFKEI